MNKRVMLGILFFGTLWGVSEVFLGEALYGAHLRWASVPLCVVALVVLTLARVHFPRPGVATAIAGCAALYKAVAMAATLIDTPFYACHLLGIVALGAAYDLVFSLLGRRHPAVGAVAATYLGHIAFAVLIAYVFRYQPWVRGGLAKVVRYVGINGTATAVLGGVLVPLTLRLGAALRQRRWTSLAFESPVPAGVAGGLVAGLWTIGLLVSV